MEKTEHLNIRMTPKQKRLITKYAKQDNRAPSDWARLIILGHIDKLKAES